MTMEDDSECPLLQLPDHVLLKVVRNLTVFAVNNFRQTSRYSYCFVRDNSRHVKKLYLNQISVRKNEENNSIRLRVSKCSVERPRRVWTCVFQLAGISEQAKSIDIGTFYTEHRMGGMKWGAATKDVVIACDDVTNEMRTHLEFLMDRAYVEELVLSLPLSDLEVVKDVVHRFSNPNMGRTNLTMNIYDESISVVRSLIKMCRPKETEFTFSPRFSIPLEIFSPSALEDVTQLRVSMSCEDGVEHPVPFTDNHLIDLCSKMDRKRPLFVYIRGKSMVTEVGALSLVQSYLNMKGHMLCVECRFHNTLPESSVQEIKQTAIIAFSPHDFLDAYDLWCSERKPAIAPPYLVKVDGSGLTAITEAAYMFNSKEENIDAPEDILDASTSGGEDSDDPEDDDDDDDADDDRNAFISDEEVNPVDEREINDVDQ